MRIRKLSLAEWFLHYQLKFSFFEYAHLSYCMDIDVTALVERAEKQGLRFSPTGATIKAVDLLAKKLPKLNRILFHTPWGMRIAEPDEVRVNIPVIIQNNGNPVLSAMVLGDLEDKAVPEIHGEIKTFSESDLSDKPVGRTVYEGKNTWYNRFILRLIHFIAHRFPGLHVKNGGGAFSVTSIIRRDVPQMWLRGTGLGHTILTLTINGLKQRADNCYTLILGFDCNHSVMSGDEFSLVCATLAEILAEPDLDAFYPQPQKG